MHGWELIGNQQYQPAIPNVDTQSQSLLKVKFRETWH